MACGMTAGGIGNDGAFDRDPSVALPVLEWLMRNGLCDAAILNPRPDWAVLRMPDETDGKLSGCASDAIARAAAMGGGSDFFADVHRHHCFYCCVSKVMR